MSEAPDPPPARSTYRHGDLRRALLEAGIELARHGGPDAVVLREATRRVGVVPNAAYRHFAGREELLQAVRTAAFSAAAVAMETELALLPPGLDPVAEARASLRAVGTGYLNFAQSETGLFRTAFAVPDRAFGPGVTDEAAVSAAAGASSEDSAAGRSGLGPFQLLGAALDKLVGAGVLPAARRPGAEFLAWSAVHGIAMLVLEGPLGRLAPQLPDIGQRVIDMVEKGL